MDGDASLEELVAMAARGEAMAWGQLWQAVEPRLFGLVRSPRVSGRLSQDVDECRNIVVEVMARLSDDDYRRLRLYLDARSERPSLTFMPWLIVVAKRVAIDYLRGHGEYIDRRRSRNTGSAPGRWMQRKTMPSESRIGGLRPQLTNHGVAMGMMRYAYAELPADQLKALEQWVVGGSYGDIAAELGLGSEKEAEKLVRAALQRLRRHFRGRSS